MSSKLDPLDQNQVQDTTCRNMCPKLDLLYQAQDTAVIYVLNKIRWIRIRFRIQQEYVS